MRDYEDRADYQDHVTYAVGNWLVMNIAKLRSWPDEATFWNMHSAGTKFLRSSKVESPKEVIDHLARVARLDPIKMVPDARRAFDGLYDITGEWPGAKETKS